MIVVDVDRKRLPNDLQSATRLHVGPLRFDIGRCPVPFQPYGPELRQLEDEIARRGLRDAVLITAQTEPSSVGGAPTTRDVRRFRVTAKPPPDWLEEGPPFGTCPGPDGGRAVLVRDRYVPITAEGVTFDTDEHRLETFKEAARSMRLQVDAVELVNGRPVAGAAK